MATTKKADSKPKPDGKQAAPRPKQRAARPEDDPIASIAAGQEPGYAFAFDAAGLEAAVANGPTREAAIEVFASEVQANMQEASASRIAAVDPTFIAAIIQAVLAIVQACPKAKVMQALAECRSHPKSLQARFTRLSLARRLPGHWGQDALDAARAIIDTGVQNRDSDLFAAAYPDEPGQGGGPVAAAQGEAPAPQ